MGLSRILKKTGRLGASSLFANRIARRRQTGGGAGEMSVEIRHFVLRNSKRQAMDRVGADKSAQACQESADSRHFFG